ncbi:MAG TPA: hypothetical protein V6D21_19535 [Candidatus Obscuribacterales bacterium]
MIEILAIAFSIPVVSPSGLLALKGLLQFIGNYNLKDTVCHNTKTDRSSYSSRCEQQRATVQS